MKLLIKSAVVTVVVLGLALRLFGVSADGGLGHRSHPESNDKAEFSWSRLSYTTALGGGGYGGFGGDVGGTAYGRRLGATW